MEQHINNPAQQCWGANLLSYAFKVLYKLGVKNAVADALFRIGDEGERIF